MTVRRFSQKPWMAILIALWAVAATAQELVIQPTPFTALIDFVTWARQPAVPITIMAKPTERGLNLTAPVPPPVS